MENRYISLKNAAVYLGMSPKTLYEWALTGSIPAYKLGRVWRFDIQELDAHVHGRYNLSQSNSAEGFGRKGNTYVRP